VITPQRGAVFSEHEDTGQITGREIPDRISERAIVRGIYVAV
jgi:hypothetical protein